MIRIAILGEIGSGKSHIAKMFGYPVFNADHEVLKIYNNSNKCYKKLNKALPKYIISFPIKKKELLEAISSNKQNLKKISKIIHPEIRNKMNIFIRKNKKKKFIILNIPLFLENKINKKNDILIFVKAKKKDINKRLKKRVSFNPKIYKQLKKVQFSLEFKRKKSNYIIKNNFINKLTKKSVKNILKRVLLNA